MLIRSLFTVCLLGLVSYVTQAQVSKPVSAQPKITNSNLKLDPKLHVSIAAQSLTGGSRKSWKLTGLTTNGYKRGIDGLCMEDNILILSSDQNANYSEGANVCTKSVSQVNNLKWELSQDNKKLLLSGLPVPTTDNKNAMLGFLLGSEAEITELNDKTLRLKFKATDGYIDGKLDYVTNEVTYTAQ
ncbi:hypothetical protein [Xanthocytophaga flava]|uniref:hypothetical protein n=1 Tax=Xanthocytophaga flava TaxID=3048013 RepID=UPI0028D1DB81|nr:hypothetical protein [Xanthocytophaga flavus]MDJ1470729.1 hypothetical protein [Xanthocytophaga flavus]